MKSINQSQVQNTTDANSYTMLEVKKKYASMAP